MVKKILVAGLVIVALVAGGLYFWARAIFASETVRTAVERQLTDALGQPVRIGAMGATVLPRVTMTLEDVRIGEPARITAGRLAVGASLRALISRRIEQGSVELAGARIELPLPPFAIGGNDAADSADAAGAPVEIVSIDRISLRDVQIVSGGRTLTGDVDLALAGQAVTIERANLSADGTSLTIGGRIADIAGPTGELTVSAPTLDAIQVIGFVSDFAAGSSAPAAAPAATAPAPVDRVPMDLAVSVDAGRATFGTLALDALKGRARVTGEAVTLDPISFDVFGGHYGGTLGLTLGATPGFRLNAAITGLDLAAFMAFAGQPDLMTGRLTGRMDVSGRGTTPDAVTQSAAGTARIDAVDGTIRNLGLVRTIVLAGSMRADSQAQARSASSTEPFTRLGATLAIGGGTAKTDDLHFESPDLILNAAGTIALDASRVDLTGRAQLSDELSKQAGRDLLRYTREDGRVTLPVVVRGPAADLSVTIDTGAVLKRAIQNRAEEELKEVIKKGLKGMLGK
jgi:uncharacterized protein involved in outer membrane biogenesis